MGHTGKRGTVRRGRDIACLAGGFARLDHGRACRYRERLRIGVYDPGVPSDRYSAGRGACDRTGDS